MKKYLIVLSSLVLLSSCKNEEKEAEVKEEGYEVLGTIKNVPDSTMVVLSANNVNIDSAYVVGEQFRLIGKVEEPTNVYLMVKNTRDYHSFWLENNKMTFDAEKDNFRETKVTGSRTEEENQILSSQINPLRKEMDSLRGILQEDNITAAQKDSIRADLTKLRKKEMEVDKKFIRKYPNSLVSAHILNIYKTTWGKEETSDLFALMSTEQKESKNGKFISRFIELSQDPQVGDKYIDLAQANVDGEMVILSDVKGKYTLIEFWASWCGPCRMTNPQLVKNYERFKDQGFEIYAISLDQHKGSWLKAIKDDGLTWINVSDLTGSNNEAALIYGINGIPDNFLIDETGTIIARDLRGETFTKKLEEVFAKKQIASAESGK